MGQLTPIALEDGTTIYIEATDDTPTPRSEVVRGTPYDDNAPTPPFPSS
ncbi:MAG: hypothetical protein KME27_28095 [Lyngbya sp. HA4199-MV5]|jgi:hypothetical protein|nr:hypothetical protein [Lyngbya sp. HA4199-MV5]